MKDEIINDIVTILKGGFAHAETVSLHELLWTVDMKHHLIPNLAELNLALERIGGIQKTYDEKEIKLKCVGVKESDFLTNEDIDKAMEIYNDFVTKSRSKPK